MCTTQSKLFNNHTCAVFFFHCDILSSLWSIFILRNETRNLTHKCAAKLHLLHNSGKGLFPFGVECYLSFKDNNQGRSLSKKSLGKILEGSGFWNSRTSWVHLLFLSQNYNDHLFVGQVFNITINDETFYRSSMVCVSISLS